MQTVLFHALELFGCCLGIHILVWRTFPVRNQILRLSMIFILGPVLLIGAYALAARLKPDIFPMADWTSWGLSCLLHLALSGVYVNLFTAVTGFSPSIGILQR